MTPKAVLISDIHYNLNNLELAEAALRMAIDRANTMGLPLIIAGDLHDTKAMMRGECVNRLIETMQLSDTRPIVLIGNHCLINERSKEHSLEFLRPYCHVIDEPQYNHTLQIYFIPYHSDRDELSVLLKGIPKGSTLIMHQGVEGAKMGEYVLDKSSLPKECFKDFRVISGHYHARQSVICGKVKKGQVGIFNYIGTPYTTSFAEANDQPKGFQILMDDGTLEHVPTNLRKHVIIESNITDLDYNLGKYGIKKSIANNLVWLKLSGTRQSLDGFNRESISLLLGTDNYKLEKIYMDSEQKAVSKDTKTDLEVLYSLLDQIESESYRKQLIDLVEEIL